VAEHQKRLVILCQHFYPEMISTGLHMTELATALSKRGWEMTVVCAPPQLDDASSTADPVLAAELPGIRIVRLRSIGSHASGFLARGLFAVVFTVGAMLWLLTHRAEYDGVLVTTNPPFLGIAPALGRLFTRRPYVLLVYDVYPDIAVALGTISRGGLVARAWRVISRAIASSADRIVVIGRDMQAIVQGNLARSKWPRIRLIPNWSDEANVKPVAKEANRFITEMGLQGRVVIQYAGRLGSTHNLEPLVDAAGLLADLPIIVQIIGNGPKSASLQRRAVEAGAANVQFLGYQPHDRLDEVLSAADIAVVCLGREFTGLSVPSKTYGILASGKPVLALLGCDSEIGLLLAEERCGVVLENASAANVATAVRSLLVDAGTLTQMSERARAAFLREYTLSRAAERYDSCLSEAFAG
jgi:glycosyltransferase involved in cell wall biosynthesis